MSELLMLQAIRLKGRSSVEALAACAATDVDAARSQVEALIAAGSAKAAGVSFRITPEGKERLAALLGEERGTLDHDALTASYEDFDAVNTELKSVVTAWQMRDDATPNDHTDPAYDQAVVGRLAALHERVTPLLERIVAQAPRLAPYPGRFAHAVAQVQAGDHSFVARPLADSYHTVWFELHEELIGLLGLSRVEEAAAGRAV